MVNEICIWRSLKNQEDCTIFSAQALLFPRLAADRH